jgi:hypothetical protein
MMMFTVIMVVMVAITTVSAAFRLERVLQLYKLRSEAMEHLLDHMIGPDSKNLVANFGRQMPVPQMPGEAHELLGILVPDFHNRLRSGLHYEQSPIFKLQGVPIGHRNRFRKIEKDVLALIRGQANAAAMARVEIERERAGCAFPGPIPGKPMN